MASKLQIVTEFSQKKTLELASVRGKLAAVLKNCRQGFINTPSGISF